MAVLHLIVDVVRHRALWLLVGGVVAGIVYVDYRDRHHSHDTDKWWSQWE